MASHQGHVAYIDEEDAVTLAYATQAKDIAVYIKLGLSVLLRCDKLVVDHMCQAVAREAWLRPVTPCASQSGAEEGHYFTRYINVIARSLKLLRSDEFLALHGIDCFLTNDGAISPWAQELVNVLYDNREKSILCFVDGAANVADFLLDRFAADISLSGLPEHVSHPALGEKVPLGYALVTQEEAERIDGFNPATFYKHVSGMGPVRLRQAIRFALSNIAPKQTISLLEFLNAVRQFKVRNAPQFEIPDVTFKDIGGYEDVKKIVRRSLFLLKSTEDDLLASDRFRRDLMPGGFLFYGHAGTGKTLFARAIANELGATIRVVSGPEIVDKYVGESERKIRQLFAEARNNAPAVIVFDEFDSIASRRSDTPDGGGRAANAVVAQILTEMDGFRPSAPVLVVGTTNRLDLIDPALLRPSRFQALCIDLPDEQARKEISRVHAAYFGIPISEELLELVAVHADGFNGDEIKSLFRDAFVGARYDDPPKVIDGRRLGFLVGQVQRRQQSLVTQARSRPGGRRSVFATLTPLSPTSEEDAMMTLTLGAPRERPTEESGRERSDGETDR